MPAYFNLPVQSRRDKLCLIFVKDFYALFNETTMKFQSGYWGFEGDSLEETTEWNQRKLEEDLNLGLMEHHSHDYKQVIYKFGGHFEMQRFWMNNYPEGGGLTHETIIPESDVLAEGYPIRFEEGRIEELLGFSKRIWQLPSVRVIQTGLEIEDDSAGLAELAQGGFPNAWSFAIVEDLRTCYEDSVYDIQSITEGKEGPLFRRTGADNEQKMRRIL